MKKILIPVLGLLLAVLCACGKTPAPDTDATDASTAAESTTEAEEVTWDTGDFQFVKSDLPEGWTVNKQFSTSTYLEANLGEGETAPRLTVSVMTYDDQMGASKSKTLADKVYERESDNATKVEQIKIGGLDFYTMSYDSKMTEDSKMRCYVFFGQTVPDKNKEYKFVEIQLDNVKDEKQYESLKGVLDTLSFKF